MQIMQTQPAAALTMVGARAAPPESAVKGHFQVAKPPGPPGHAPPKKLEYERKPKGAEPIARPEEPDPLATNADTKQPDPLLGSAAGSVQEASSFNASTVAPVSSETHEDPAPQPFPTTDGDPVVSASQTGTASPVIGRTADSTLSADEVQWLGVDSVEVQSVESQEMQPADPGNELGKELLEKKGARGAAVQSEPDASVDAVAREVSKGPVRPTEPDGLRQPTDSLKADVATGSDPSAELAPSGGSQPGSRDEAGDANRGASDEPMSGAPVKGDSETREHSPDLSVGMRIGATKEAATDSRPVEGAARVVVDRASVVRQIADRLELLSASRPREGVTIRLNPIELGTITLNVRRSGGEVETRVVASHEAVRVALESSRPQLQHALETRGLNLGSLDVGGGQPHQGSSSQDLARDAARGRHPTEEAARLGASFAANDWRESTRRATGVDLWI